MEYPEARYSGQIFYVDDEVEVCDAVARALSRAGFTIKCFNSIEECINQLDQNRCDLLITDIRFPGRDGWELTAHIKHNFPWLPVVLITQYGDVATAVEAMKRGAEDFIEKPLDGELLVSCIHSILKKNGVLDSSCGKTLTRSEMKVLKLILEGKSNAEVANVLHRAKCTVEVHRKRIMKKLGAHNVVDLVMKATKMGYNNVHSD